jgi:hypothetical protein
MVKKIVEELQAVEEKINSNSPEWNEHVLSHFQQDELVDGNPTVDGLRRVAELLIGPITSGKANVVQSPNPDNDGRCVVSYTVIVKSLNGSDLIFEQTSIADCFAGNCDPRFAVFASAVAETRAEGRALRKLLRLRKIIAAEEAGLVPAEENGSNGKITATQMSFIETLCNRNDINVPVYLGDSKSFSFSGRLEEVPYRSAVAIIAHLSELQRNNASINPKYKGYNPNWRK